MLYSASYRRSIDSRRRRLRRSYSRRAHSTSSSSAKSCCHCGTTRWLRGGVLFAISLNSDWRGLSARLLAVVGVTIVRGSVGAVNPFAFWGCSSGVWLFSSARLTLRCHVGKIGEFFVRNRGYVNKFRVFFTFGLGLLRDHAVVSCRPALTPLILILLVLRREKNDKVLEKHSSHAFFIICYLFRRILVVDSENLPSSMFFVLSNTCFCFSLAISLAAVRFYFL